ncbi:MAG: cytochrome C biogenesis protein, partial [Verrucomicrobiae bacterium]|nr:cytochrome C biogenesis protein [Verrucomicrobiae bacterium]
MKKFSSNLFPIIVLFLAAILILNGLRPKKIKAVFDYDRFARLPVLDGGRYKPLDSLARTDLLIIRGKQYVLDDNGK